MLFSKKAEIPKENLPVHVGIIMDGNGRWAQKRGLPRTAGHTAGAANFRKITRYCSSIGIKYLTVYAFSTENWKRPTDEVGALLTLFSDYLEEALRDFTHENYVVKFLGDISAFPESLQQLIIRTTEASKDKTGMVLNIALNYGGRAEIVNAVKEISKLVKNGEISEDEIDDTMISDFLYTKGQPDPDLIIRPSGEHRTSNFLLWQSAYSEYVIMDILWPDFSPNDMDAALMEYAKRKRRFGGI